MYLNEFLPAVRFQSEDPLDRFHNQRYLLLEMLVVEADSFGKVSLKMSAITITVKLFAAYQEAYNQSELKLQFPSSVPVATVLDHLLQEHPELASWREVTRFGVNWEFVPENRLIEDGDEVVLIPPVSGG